MFKEIVIALIFVFFYILSIINILKTIVFSGDEKLKKERIISIIICIVSTIIWASIIIIEKLNIL